MKKLCAKQAALLLLAGGLFVLSQRLVFASASFSIQIPAVAMDFSDLDVRDHNNRPMTSASKQNELRRLFEKSLSHLLLSNALPTTRTVQFVLSQSWKTAFGWFRKAVGKIATALVAWFSKHKWIKVLIVFRFGLGYDVATKWRRSAGAINFHSLIPTLLSSTTLLR
jgi:hypothetical protein